MGNFEKAIPQNIQTLEREMAVKRRRIWDIEREYNHECDCEYCTVEPEPVPEEEQQEIDNLEAEITDTKVMINRLKRHAKANGIEVAS